MPWIRLGGVSRKIRENRAELALVALFCAIAFLGAAWTSDSVFERLPHTEDESAFLFQAQTIAGGQLIADAPERPEFFSIPFVIVRDGMWFGKYPPGFPAVLALGVAIGAPWVANALFAAGCVALIYGFSRWLFGTATGLFATALLTVSPFFLLQAGSLLSHIVSLFWTLLFLALFPVARTRPGAVFPVIAGAAVGMLFVTRPLTAVGIAIPFLAWVLLSAVRRRGFHRSDLLVAAGALPFVVGFLIYNDVTTGSPFRTAYELWWEFDRLGFGPDIGINGHDLDDGLRNTRRNAETLAMYLFGWPGRSSFVPAISATVASLFILGARYVRRPRIVSKRPHVVGQSPEAWDLILASVAISLMAIHILYWTPGHMYGPRYFMEAIGPLVILSARCFARLGCALSSGVDHLAVARHHSRSLTYVVLVAAIMLLTAYAHLSWAPDEYDRYRAWNDVTSEDIAAVDSAGLDNALVFVERSTWTDYAPFFARHGPDLDADIVYAGDRGNDENQLLMDLYPERAYYRYADGQLTRIGP